MLLSNLELMLYRAQIFEGLWASTPIVVVDQTSGEILAASPPLLDLFGYEAADLDGQTIEALVPEAVREAHARHRADYAAAPKLRPMGAPGMTLRGRRRDGSTFPVSIELAPTTIDTDRQVIIAVLAEVAA